MNGPWLLWDLLPCLLMSSGLGREKVGERVLALDACLGPFAAPLPLCTLQAAT